MYGNIGACDFAWVQWILDRGCTGVCVCAAMRLSIAAHTRIDECVRAFVYPLASVRCAYTVIRAPVYRESVPGIYEHLFIYNIIGNLLTKISISLFKDGLACHIQHRRMPFASLFKKKTYWVCLGI